MFVINTQFTKRPNWWFWLCKVFEIDPVWDIKEITKSISIEWDFKFDTKWYGTIKIYHWCGTAYVRIKEVIRKIYWLESFMVNVSI